MAQFGVPGDPARGAPPGTEFCKDCGLIVADEMLARHQDWHQRFEVLKTILEARKSGGHLAEAVVCKECGGRVHMAHVRFYSSGHQTRELTIGYWCGKCNRLVPLTQKAQL